MKKLYATKFSPKELVDTMAAELLEVAKKKKRAGEDVVKIEEPESEEAAEVSGNVLDLMERLRQSLKTDGASESGGRSSSRGKRPRKRAAKKRSRGRAA
jgi:non-homologous end joining protein Ku